MSQLHARDILIAPVVSEKSYGLLDENKYTFLVRKDANKTEIKLAVEELFKVKVLNVNTSNRIGKKIPHSLWSWLTSRFQAGDREPGARRPHRYLQRAKCIRRIDGNS